MGLQFFDKTHLFSYSEDGTIVIWKAGSWECLRTLRGHKYFCFVFLYIYIYILFSSCRLCVMLAYDF